MRWSPSGGQLTLKIRSSSGKKPRIVSSFITKNPQGEITMFPINQIINVTSFYFANGQTFKSYPRQIEFGNTRFTFTDGMQYIVKQGEKAIKLFDMIN